MAKKRYRVNYRFYILIFIIIILIIYFLFFNKREIKMIDLSSMTLTSIQEYAKDNKLELDVTKEYSDTVAKDKLISQNIKTGTIIEKNDSLKVIISLGPIPMSVYRDSKVNELGNVPIMMYHGIVEKKDENSIYPGGNVDKDGYTRTKDAFIADLEMYYEKGYRMIRLIDYINGKINVPLGKSPIVLTFDDGNKNNFNVLGVDADGNLEIDPNCAVGILESFKKKYKDYNVTATFFLNKGLFNQSKYNNQILKWLVEHDYDIGNHTKSHVNFTEVDTSKSQEEIAYMYKLFDEIIPNKYVHIVALPFGSPYNKTHSNFPYILSGSYDGYEYVTDGTLRVGWESNYSPYHKSFDKSFMKRVRAWDNNGLEFDIEMVFKNLNNNRYISDGDINKIVIPNDSNLNQNIKDKKIIKY